MQPDFYRPQYFLLVPENQQFIERRQPHYNRAMRRFVYFWVVFFTVVGLIFGFLNWDFWTTNFKYDNEGRQVQATVTGKTSSYSGKSHTYRVQFAYEAGYGRAYSGSEVVDYDYYRDHVAGDKIEVVYLPESPDEARIIGQFDLTKAIIFAIFLGVSLLFLPLVIRNLIRRRLLEKTGHLIPASLGNAFLKVQKQRYRTNYILRVDFQFQNPYGQFVTGKASYVRNDLFGYPLPPPGTPLMVLYANDKLFQLM